VTAVRDAHTLGHGARCPIPDDPDCKSHGRIAPRGAAGRPFPSRPSAARPTSIAYSLLALVSNHARFRVGLVGDSEGRLPRAVAAELSEPASGGPILATACIRTSARSIATLLRQGDRWLVADFADKISQLDWPPVDSGLEGIGSLAWRDQRLLEALVGYDRGVGGCNWSRVCVVQVFDQRIVLDPSKRSNQLSQRLRPHQVESLCPDRGGLRLHRLRQCLHRR
jgi:hypothetical protein